MNRSLAIERLPHQPPMRWVVSAARVSADEIVAHATLPAEFGEEGTASVLLGLEILAQAAGVLLANAPEASEVPSEGRLLQVMTAHWHADDLSVAIALEAKVKRLDSSAMGLHKFLGSLSGRGGEILLEAEFSLLVAAPAV